MTALSESRRPVKAVMRCRICPSCINRKLASICCRNVVSTVNGGDAHDHKRWVRYHLRIMTPAIGAAALRRKVRQQKGYKGHVSGIRSILLPFCLAIDGCPKLLRYRWHNAWRAGSRDTRLGCAEALCSGKRVVAKKTRVPPLTFVPGCR